MGKVIWVGIALGTVSVAIAVLHVAINVTAVIDNLQKLTGLIIEIPIICLRKCG